MSGMEWGENWSKLCSLQLGGRVSLTDVIMYDVDDHCYGKKLVRHCPMTSLFQALRWYM